MLRKKPMQEGLTNSWGVFARDVRDRYEDDEDEEGGGGGADGPQMVESTWLDEHYKKRNWQVKFARAY